MEWFEVLVDILATLVFNIGQLLPYIPQYIHMTQARDSSGFSRNVPLVIISASIMRLHFWLGKPFGLVLVAQSLVMIFSQLFLLHTCVKYSRDHLSASPRPLWKDFGSWQGMLIYYTYLCVFWATAAFLTALCYPSAFFFEVLGCVALFVEASLALPQLAKNAAAGSTEGLSPLMVWGWFLGDAMKTAYFLFRSEPAQFVAGGSIQIAIDILILGQMWHYKAQKGALRAPMHPYLLP